SMLPMNCSRRGLALKSACVSLARSWPFCSSEPTFMRPMVGRCRSRIWRGGRVAPPPPPSTRLGVAVWFGRPRRHTHAAHPAQGGHEGRNPGPADVLQVAPEAEPAGNHGACVAGADNCLHLVLGQKLPAAANRVIRLLAECHHRTVLHADHLRAMEQLNAGRRRLFEAALDLVAVANE